MPPPSSALPFPLPLLSPTQSSLLSALLTSIYVGSLYLARASRIASHSSSPSAPFQSSASPALIVENAATDSLPKSLLEEDQGEEEKTAKPLGRDDPQVMKSRMRAVGAATIGCCLGVWGVVKWGLRSGPYTSVSTLLPTLSLLGIPTSLPSPSIASSKSVLRSLLPYLLTPTLFLGPLYSDILLERTSPSDAWKNLNTLRGLRNYIVAPITEELVFRSCIIACASLSSASARHLIFVTPLWFGLAHVHHAYEVFVSNGRTSQAAVVALASCVFQFAYTTMFGWFSAYLFVSTGSILPPFLSHMFCNSMGLPQPSYAIMRHPEMKARISLAYVVGIVGFVWGLSTAVQMGR